MFGGKIKLVFILYDCPVRVEVCSKAKSKRTQSSDIPLLSCGQSTPCFIERMYHIFAGS